jgi:hypothetical protein
VEFKELVCSSIICNDEILISIFLNSFATNVDNKLLKVVVDDYI